MKRSVVNRYYRDIIRALDDCTIQWSPCPRIDGGKVVRGWHRGSEIAIQNCPARENIVLTIIHEALHHAYDGDNGLPEHDSLGESESFDLLSRQLFCEFTTKQLDGLRVCIPPEVLNGKRKIGRQKPPKNRKHPPTQKRR